MAAAIPLGKGSCSTLMSWRLVGTARNTPRHEMTTIHGISQRQRVQKSCGRTLGSSIISAGMALTSPSPDINPAAEAADCMALFSRIVKSGNRLGKSLCSVEKIV